MTARSEVERIGIPFGWRSFSPAWGREKFSADLRVGR
jgi:hypothetical protein